MTHSKSILLSLYLCVFLSVFSYTSSIMAGIYIVGSLGGSNDISSYTVVFYGLGNALVFPLSSKLAEWYGKERVLCASLLLFCIPTFLCIFADHFFTLVIYRFFQGAFAGTFFPLSVGLILQSTPPEKKNTAFSSIAFLATITPVLGATYGGWIAYEYDWRWSFLWILPFALGIYFVLRKLPSSSKTEKTPLDWIGYGTYCLACSSLVTAITLGQQLDWQRSFLICFLFALGSASLLFFILWEWHHETPFMDLTLFRSGAFTLSIIYVALLFSAYFGMIILLSLWLHLFVNYTPIWINLLLIHMVIAGAILYILMLKWIGKTSPLLPVLGAVLFFGISCYYSTHFNVEVNFGRIAISRILAGFALAFFLFPLLLIALESAPPDKDQQALGIFQSVRLLAGGLGCSIYTTLWYRRGVFYHDRLGSSLTYASDPLNESLQELHTMHIPNGSSLALLESALNKQATALALEDCFYLMAWVMGILFFILLIYSFRKKAFSI